MPTRNVSRMVGNVLASIDYATFEQVGHLVVIDNGSSDATIDTIRTSALYTQYPQKFSIILNGTDKGYGFSIKKGLEFLSLNTGTEVMGILHSDDQFDAQEVITLYLANLKEVNESCLLIRRDTKNRTRFNLKQSLRDAGNYILSLFASIAVNCKIRDLNSPFMMISKKSYLQMCIDFKFKDDIFFHPRMNLLLHALMKVNYESCRWHRASKTTRIPITLMGVKIVQMIFLFGIHFRILHNSIQEAYGAILDVE